MKVPTPNRVKTFENPSVWLEFSPLAQLTESINLGQGYPDWAPPTFLQEIAQETIKGSTFSSYARSAGHPPLCKIIAEQYSEKLKHKINPKTQVLVTVGASEALFLSMMAFIEKNDEVIVIEPGFDIYYGALAMAEAQVKPVPLKAQTNIKNASEFELDWQKLEEQLSEKTRALILNTPHNPTGKVFSRAELERLAKILEKYPNVIVISDEVYENLVYDDKKHIPIASLANMFQRTLSIYSAGKTFSTTGWKIGWMVGPPALIQRLQHTQQWVVFSVSTPHQEAIAQALQIAMQPYKGFKTYYEWLHHRYHHKRNLLFKGLEHAKLSPVMPQGSFFILAKTPSGFQMKPTLQEQILEWDKNHKLHLDKTTLNAKDYQFCRELSFTKKVTAIPTSAFYQAENKQLGESWVRFTFCKDDSILREASERLL